MAFDPSISARNDMDSLSTLVARGSAVGPSICDSGDETLAVIDSPELETNSITQSNVCPPLNNNHCRDTYHYNGSDQRRISI